MSHKEERRTDPYGALEWCVGSGDDFWCFDYDIDHKANTVRLHAVVNSETGSFIQDAEPPVEVPFVLAVSEAKRLVESALDWCAESDLEHDAEGWNQDPSYFWRALHADLHKTGRVSRFEEEE